VRTACRAYATGMTSVRPSVRLWIVSTWCQQKVEIGTWHRIGRYLSIAACRRRSGSWYPVIWVWKNVQFCTSAAFNDSHVALSQHPLSVLLFLRPCNFRRIGPTVLYTVSRHHHCADGCLARLWCCNNKTMLLLSVMRFHWLHKGKGTQFNDSI